MRRHYARYTPEMVERVTGCPRETFLQGGRRAREEFRPRDAPARSATRSAGRITRVGVQIIRAASIIQGLLGNVGRPGGGIMALRGHASIQGSTDIPTLYNMLPTYLPQPNVFHAARHACRTTSSTRDPADRLVEQPAEIRRQPAEGLVRRRTRSADNEWGYQHLPKLTGDLSQLPMTLAMVDGVVKGQFILGQNPGGRRGQLRSRGTRPVASSNGWWCATSR